MTVAFGTLLFVLTAYIMSYYTLQTTTRDVMLVLQGIALQLSIHSADHGGADQHSAAQPRGRDRTQLLAAADVAARLARISVALPSRGFSTENAERMLSALVQRQVRVLSFEKLFLLAGILFLGVLPLLTFLKIELDQAGPV
jgi:hypothetical protein